MSAGTARRRVSATAAARSQPPQRRRTASVTAQPAAPTSAAVKASAESADRREEWLLRAVISPWKRWLLVGAVAALLGGFSWTAPAAIWLLAILVADIAVSCAWMAVRRLIGQVKKRRGTQ